MSISIIFQVFSSGGDHEQEQKNPDDDFAIYLTTSHGAKNLREELPSSLPLQDNGSLFTQEEDIDPDQVQSLREFEQLEQLALGNEANQRSLIGSYLKGMENQQMLEDPSLQGEEDL